MLPNYGALDGDEPPEGSPVEFWTSEAKRALDASLRESVRRSASLVSNRDIRAVVDRQTERTNKHESSELADSAGNAEPAVVTTHTDRARPDPAGGEESLAQRRLVLLGVPSKLDQPYTEEDARRVLQGHGVAPTITDTIHKKLSWVVGVQVVGFINNKSPQLGWTSNRVLVRTLSEGESSARPLSFPDGSHAILLGQSLQESLICIANVIQYLDVASGVARLSFRRRRLERLSPDLAAAV